MALSTGSPHTIHPARHDLGWAWASVATMVVVVAATVAVMSNVSEGMSFAAQMLVFAAFVAILVGLAAVAIRLGIRARHAGRDDGTFPAAVAGTIAGFFLVLAVLTLIGHLLGAE